MFTWEVRTQGLFWGTETEWDWNDWTWTQLQVLRPPSPYDLRAVTKCLRTSVFLYLKWGKQFYFLGESVRIKIRWCVVEATWYRVNVQKCGFTPFSVLVGAGGKQRTSETSSQGKTQGLGESKGGDFGRARVTEREGEGDWEPHFLNAYHHVPGISVVVRGSRMNSVKRRENLTRTDWFDLRALLFGVFSLLLFKVI